MDDLRYGDPGLDDFEPLAGFKSTSDPRILFNPGSLGRISASSAPKHSSAMPSELDDVRLRS